MAVSVGMVALLVGLAFHLERLAHIGLGLTALGLASYLLRRGWSAFTDYGWLRSVLAVLALTSIIGAGRYLIQGLGPDAQGFGLCIGAWAAASTVNRYLPAVVTRISALERS